MENDVKFYEKDWFMWITLFVFAPIGIFLAWKYKRFNSVARGIISVIFLLVFLIEVICLFGGGSSSSTSNLSDKATSADSASDTKKSKAEDKEAAKKKAAEEKAKEEEAKKEAAEKWTNFVKKNTKKLSAGTYTVGKQLDAGLYDVKFNGDGNFSVESKDGDLLSNEVTGSDLGVVKYRAMFPKGAKVKAEGMTMNVKPVKEKLHSGKFTLYTGYWYVGKDIKAGRYKVKPVKGSGNFFVYDESGDADTNEILGRDKSMGEVKSVIIDLKNGQVVAGEGLREFSLTPEK